MHSYRFPGIVLVVLLLQSPVRADEIAADSFQQIEHQLAVVTSLHLTDVPLNEALETLGEQVGMKFVIESKALGDLGLKPDELVSISVDNVALELLLELLLGQLDLTYLPRGEVVMVTSDEEALTQLCIRVYPVPDLLGTAKEVAQQGHDYDTVIDTIISVVDSDTWVENGGPEAEIRPFPAANAIVISQTFQSHRKIERLLADLRRLRVQQGLPVATERSFNSRRTNTLALPKTYVPGANATTLPRVYAE
ncbi:hypothetical protein [Aeoliella sp. SH292]|uniref:hypothetical protein n=1 Tax=Aeoliella sp. SH292 TaxID=3454464 RepID=UPI003F9CE254